MAKPEEEARVSTEMLPRFEENQNLLSHSGTSQSDDAVPVLHPTWFSRCQHGRWHSYVTAAACVLLAMVLSSAVVSIGILRWEAIKHSHETARPLRTLDKHVVILISLDGFRFGYNWKAATPSIDKMRLAGVEAELGMIPVFPTKTFPNHYSIATGLYPAYHGIVGNTFRDPDSNDSFYPGNVDPKWWLGEPIWETAVNQGLQAATYFWPGSQVKRGNWTCDPRFCQDYYNSSVPYEERVDAVLGFLDLPSKERPRVITLYFESPDTPGHETGPDAPQITSAVVRIDDMMGRLFEGLEKRRMAEDVTVILVGDHGMAPSCGTRVIYLEDLAPGVSIPRDWVVDHSPVLQIRPPPNVDVTVLHREMARTLASGSVPNAEFLNIYLKEQLPPRLHYSESSRIAPIVGLVAEGYTLVHSRTDKPITCGGTHGYDNALLSMRTIFIACGPKLPQGRKIPSFENVELYHLMTSILGLTPAPNNATNSFASDLLLPRR